MIAPIFVWGQNAMGVHLGQDDVSVAGARKICPGPFLIGISAHNPQQGARGGQNIGGLHRDKGQYLRHHPRTILIRLSGLRGCVPHGH